MLWDVEKREKSNSHVADQSALFAAAFLPDGKSIVTGGRERVVRVWGFADLRLVDELRGPKETVLAVGISPDGAHLAAGMYDGRILLWER